MSRGFDHQGSNQVVGDERHLQLFVNHFRSLAAKALHAHGGCDVVACRAYVYANDVYPGLPSSDVNRIEHPVKSIQMDIMVRDPRADAAGGWLFGKFARRSGSHLGCGCRGILPRSKAK